MRRIGILTYWGVPNYGAWIQAYALNRLLTNLYPDDEILDIAYLNDIHWNAYYKTDVRLCNAFSYSWNEIPHTRYLSSKELNKEHFDIIVTGSDAIWEFSVPEMGNDVHLVGHDLNARQFVAYAASFGVTEETDLPKWVQEGLLKYKAISVRDEHSKAIVDHLIEKDRHTESVLVLDPSLVYDYKTDLNIKVPIYVDYIAVYGIDFSEDFIKQAKVFAQERGLKLLSIGFINSWCDINLKMVELRTFEWLGLVQHANYIVTSTFHGLMMSLAFNKKVIFYQTSYVKNRSDTLLKLLGLKETINDFTCADSLDYFQVERKLMSLRNSSISFLRSAINYE